MNIDSIYRQGSDLWQLNTCILASESYSNIIKELVQMALTSTALSNQWWFESIKFNRQPSLDQAGMEINVLEVLEEVLRLGYAFQIVAERTPKPYLRNAGFRLK